MHDLLFDSENGSRMVFRSVGKLLLDYTASAFVITTAVRTLRSFRLEYSLNSSFVFPCCVLFTLYVKCEPPPIPVKKGTCLSRKCRPQRRNISFVSPAKILQMEKVTLISRTRHVFKDGVEDAEMPRTFP